MKSNASSLSVKPGVPDVDWKGINLLNSSALEMQSEQRAKAGN